VFVRWDNLKVDAEESRTLPGYREPATVRTFDAPEALDTRFYEIRAKSALNRVPKASRMPFRWTINPYRGCAHACTFCAAGDTPILMGDGSHRRLGELRVGDEIYGTVREDPSGKYRRYRRTVVRDHWSSIKPAWRILLDDGRTLVTSADHRFLSRRGWKYVFGTEHGGPLRRPHLTVGTTLLGTGSFVDGPLFSRDYRLGYLCGIVRGDALLRTYVYPRETGGQLRIHHFRLALTDLDALTRAQGYLAEEGLPLRQVRFSDRTETRRALRAIRSNAFANVSLVKRLVAWPLSPSDEWRKGFLAGIFDAEGSCRPGDALRIANCDPAILAWTEDCLRHFGFRTRVDDRGRENGLEYVRFLGGLSERLRFFHLTDPAIVRKRSIEGMALKNPQPPKVVSVEPLGVAMRLFDITTGTGDFIANGVVSHNCFARPTHTYLDFNAGRDFEKEIVVKVNVPEVARAELMRPSWKREHVALGTNTDPYQWVEGRYKLMPGIWEAMRDSRTPSSVLTKSPLLLRDIELMKEIHEAAGFAANLSIPTLDERAWRASEPHTPHPRKRIEAVAELNRQGIPCGVLIAPLMPGINDAPEQVEEILDLCGEAGAVNIGGICLHLRGEVRQIFMDWLASYRPDLVPRYERLYARGAYAPKAERDRIAALARPGRRAGPARRGGAAAEGAQPDPGGGSEPVLTPSPRPRREPVQDSLF
jgi:DNA repair photolyase